MRLALGSRAYLCIHGAVARRRRIGGHDLTPSSPEPPPVPRESSEDDLCLLSAAAVSGIEAPKAF